MTSYVILLLLEVGMWISSAKTYMDYAGNLF